MIVINALNNPDTLCGYDNKVMNFSAFFSFQSDILIRVVVAPTVISEL